MGISTETREHAVAPVREGLMGLIEARRPRTAPRSGCSRPPTCAGCRRTRPRDVSPTSSSPRSPACSLRRRPRRPPIAVRAFTPTGPSTATSHRLGARDQHRGPPVPGRLGARRARPRRASPSSACCTRSSASSATPTAASCASPPARGGRARVGHALRARPPPRHASSPRSPTPCARCSGRAPAWSTSPRSPAAAAG